MVYSIFVRSLQGSWSKNDYASVLPTTQAATRRIGAAMAHTNNRKRRRSLV
jgi:hypothetical protein